MTTLPLADTLALVTGASGTIGSAIARRLAFEGASVIAHYGSDGAGAARVVDEIRALGGEAMSVGVDLAHTDGPARLCAAIDVAFGGRFAGGVQVLVNNAGVFDYGSLIDTTDEAFDRVFTVNVRAVFQLTREVARRMASSGAGRIIMIGSVFGNAIPNANLGAYSASKFAVAGMTRAWSRDLGPLGITVNCVEPAVIQAEPLPIDGPAYEAMQRFTSVGRFGKPNEVAAAVAFLARPESAFINGTTLAVDGGWSA